MVITNCLMGTLTNSVSRESSTRRVVAEDIRRTPWDDHSNHADPPSFEWQQRSIPCSGPGRVDQSGNGRWVDPGGVARGGRAGWVDPGGG
jgi:hypothetical protein